MNKFNFSEEDIFKKIDEIYKDEKGKKFITHLIRSFFPVNKTEYLWSPPEDKKSLKCCITGHPLISKDEVLNIEIEIAESKLKLVSKSIIEQVESNGEKTEYKKELDNLLNEKYQGRLLAVSSPESDKYLAPEVHQQLYNWMATRMLHGDKHIEWLMRSMRKNESLKYAKQNNINITEQEKKTIDKAVNKRHKMSLGDNEILKGLADKFKKDEK